MGKKSGRTSTAQKENQTLGRIETETGGNQTTHRSQETTEATGQTGRIVTPPVSSLLLTGLPNVGKTTVIRKVHEQLDPSSIGGFVTDEIRKKGRRVGFRLCTFDGSEAVLSHVNIRSPHRVGRYGVDLEALDRLTATALAGGKKVYLVDEIGKMECFSKNFVRAITALLDSEGPVVATVALKGGGFIGAVKKKSDVEVWEVTRANRNEIPGRVLRWISRFTNT